MLIEHIISRLIQDKLIWPYDNMTQVLKIMQLNGYALKSHQYLITNTIMYLIKSANITQ